MKLPIMSMLLICFMCVQSTFENKDQSVQTVFGYELDDLSDNFLGIIEDPPQTFIELSINKKSDYRWEASGTYQLIPYYQRISPEDKKTSRYIIQKHPFNQQWQLTEIYDYIQRKSIFPNPETIPDELHYRTIYGGLPKEKNEISVQTDQDDRLVILLKQKIDKMKQELQQKDFTIESLERTLQRKEKKLMHFLNEIDNIEKTLKKTHGKWKDQLEENNQILKEKENLETKLNISQQNNTELSQQVQAINHESILVQHAFTNSKMLYETHFHLTCKTIENLQFQLKTVLEGKQNLEYEMNKVKHKNENIEHENNILKQKVLEIQISCDALKEKEKQTGSELKEIKNKMQQFERDFINEKTKSKKFDSLNKKLKEKMKKNEKENLELTEKYEQTQDINVALTEKFEEEKLILTEKYEKLQKQMEKQVAQNQQQRSYLLEKKGDCTFLKAQVAYYEKQKNTPNLEQVKNDSDLQSVKIQLQENEKFLQKIDKHMDEKSVEEQSITEKISCDKNDNIIETEQTNNDSSINNEINPHAIKTYHTKNEGSSSSNLLPLKNTFTDALSINIQGVDIAIDLIIKDLGANAQLLLKTTHVENKITEKINSNLKNNKTDKKDLTKNKKKIGKETGMACLQFLEEDHKLQLKNLLEELDAIEDHNIKSNLLQIINFVETNLPTEKMYPYRNEFLYIFDGAISATAEREYDFEKLFNDMLDDMKWKEAEIEKIQAENWWNQEGKQSYEKILKKLNLTYKLKALTILESLEKSAATLENDRRDKTLYRILKTEPTYFEKPQYEYQKLLMKIGYVYEGGKAIQTECKEAFKNKFKEDD